MHSTQPRKLVLYIAMSLDGFIAGPNGELDFLSTVEKEGEDYGYAAFCAQVDIVLIGKRSYEKVLSMGFDYPHKDKPVYIYTHENRPPEGNVIYYSGKLDELIHTLKSETGKHIYCDGGAELVNQLLETQLIDELIISIIPHLLGKGIRLFQGKSSELTLHLHSSQSFPSGLVQLHYVKKG